MYSKFGEVNWNHFNEIWNSNAFKTEKDKKRKRESKKARK